MTECTVLELHDKLESEEKLHLIDVREYAEFTNGRIGKSRHIPLNSLGKLHEELKTNETIYLISQNSNRSESAQNMLKIIGFDKAIKVSGGLNAWQNAGFEIEKDNEGPWELERQINFIAGTIVFLGVVLGLLLHWSFVLFSALAGLILAFESFTQTNISQQLILKMPWNQKETNK